MVYIKLVGIKVLVRYVVNILLILVILIFKNRQIKDLKKRKYTYFLLKVLVNLGLIVNFEIFQNDGKFSVFALSRDSTKLEISVIAIDLITFCFSHLYLWRLFLSNKAKQASKIQTKPYEEYMYKTVFVF